jgi:TP901 family phage tail tape measure protein
MCAVRVIETKAVIGAEDKTAQTFAAVSQKLKAMEGIAKRAGQTAGSVGVSVGSSMGGISTRVHAATRSINAMGLAIAGLATIGVEKLAKLAESVIDVGAEFDKLSRRQQAVLNISPEQQKPLIAQAYALGGTTPFKLPQVSEAQTELGKLATPLEAIKPITEAAAAYGQAQGIDIAEAARLLHASMFAEGAFKTKRSPEEIKKEALHTADVLTRASQISGMGAPEMEAFLKGHAAEAAGVSLPFLLAQGATLHQAGIPEPGQAALRFAAMLSKPTPDALAAMDAAGVHFKDYAKVGAMRAGDLSSEFERINGRKLSASGLRNVQNVLSNKAIAGDEEKLSKALTGILQEAPKKAGGKSPDAAAIAKVIKKFWESSLASVDVEGLERALIAKGLSGSQAEAIFGKRSGLMFPLLSRGAKEMAGFEKSIRETPPGLAAREAATQMGGLAGAKTRFEGGWQNVLTKLAEDTDKWMTPLYNTGSTLEKAFVEADGGVRAFTAAVVGATAVLGTIGAAGLVVKGVGRAARGEAVFGGLGAGLGAALIPTAPAIVAGMGAGLLAGSTPLNAGEDEMARQRKYGRGPTSFGRWEAPPGGGVSFPASGNATTLKGEATIKNSLAITLDPGLISKEIRSQLDAGGNLRAAPTGVSMPREGLPR